MHAPAMLPYVRTMFRPNPRGQVYFCVDLTWNDPMFKLNMLWLPTICVQEKMKKAHKKEVQALEVNM